jgi:hypothetical protein
VENEVVGYQCLEGDRRVGGLLWLSKDEILVCGAAASPERLIDELGSILEARICGCGPVYIVGEGGVQIGDWDLIAVVLVHGSDQLCETVSSIFNHWRHIVRKQECSICRSASRLHLHVNSKRLLHRNSATIFCTENHNKCEFEAIENGVVIRTNHPNRPKPCCSSASHEPSPQIASGKIV